MSLATVASVIGIGAGAKSLFGSGGGGGGGGGSTAYVPTGLEDADKQWQALMSSLQGRMDRNSSLMDPNMLTAYQQMIGVPTGGLTSSAIEAGKQYGMAGGKAAQYGNALENQVNENWDTQRKLGRYGDDIISKAQPLFTAGNQLWNTALDPQGALKAKMLQQTTDGSRAATSMRGIGMGAQSAGIENQDVQNMLINWENQQLQRQALGLQGMSGAYGQANQMYGQGGNLYGQAGNFGKLGSQQVGQAQDMFNLLPQLTQAGGTVPYEANMRAVSQPLTATNAFGSSLNANIYGPYSELLKQIIPYMNQGQGAANNAFMQGQVGLNNLTTGLGQFGQNIGRLGDMFRTGSNSYFGSQPYSGSNIGGYTNMYTGTQDASGW